VNSLCQLCEERPPTASCYVRRDGRESATCRMCWEQVFLDPRHVLVTLLDRADRRGASGPGSPKS
jgi:hypothetical protein